MKMDDLKYIFEEYRKTKDKIEMSVEQLKELVSSYNNKIVLYGAGSAGIAFYHYLNDAGIKAVCFADGDPEKYRTICEGLEILSPQEAAEKWG